MDEDCANQADPEEQLRILDKMDELTMTKVRSLKNTIENFTKQFESQEKDLTNLYEKTKYQQKLSENIITVKTYLTGVLDELNSYEKILPVLNTSPERNFDMLMKAMRDMIASRNYLDQFKFEDAFDKKQKLAQKTIETAKNVILPYFTDLATRSATPIDLDNFKFENDEFVCTVKEYEKDPLYPISENILHRMHTMATILLQLEPGANLSTVKDYSTAHSRQIMESLKPLIDKCYPRTVLPGPMNILDLPTYKKRSHPIHIYSHAIVFFFRREKAFANKIFGIDNKYGKEAFYGSIQEAFQTYVKMVSNLLAKIEAHVDILFDLDIVGTVTEMMDSLITDSELYTLQYNHLMQLQHSFILPSEAAFQKYTEAVLMHDPNAIPPRGGVTAVASNVIYFLGALTEYKKGIQQIPKLSLDTYVNGVLENLHTNILEKSKHYNDPVLKQLFLMNNAHYGYTAITQHPALSKIVDKKFIEKIEEVIQDSQSEYLNETWIKAFSILDFAQSELKLFADYKKGGDLNKQQKNIIKKKFEKCNVFVTELQNKHLTYCLKNTKLMEPIKNEATKKIHEKFEPFYNRWHDSNFHSQPEQYIKYTPSTLEAIVFRMYTKANQKPENTQK